MFSVSLINNFNFLRCLLSFIDYNDMTEFYFFSLKEMEIYQIDTDADNEINRWKKKTKPTVFTKLPFTALVYGSSGTGKSTMVANIFLRDFDGLMSAYLPKNIYIFAKNGQSDVNFRALMIHLKKIDP